MCLAILSARLSGTMVLSDPYLTYGSLGALVLSDSISNNRKQKSGTIKVGIMHCRRALE